MSSDYVTLAIVYKNHMIDFLVSNVSIHVVVLEKNTVCFSWSFLNAV